MNLALLSSDEGSLGAILIIFSLLLLPIGFFYSLILPENENGDANFFLGLLSDLL